MENSTKVEKNTLKQPYLRPVLLELSQKSTHGAKTGAPVETGGTSTGIS